MSEKIKVLTGNINRKIFHAKKGETIKSPSVDEAKMICAIAPRYGVEVTRRNCDVFFHNQIDTKKYEWVSGEPAKSNVKPSLGSVE